MVSAISNHVPSFCESYESVPEAGEWPLRVSVNCFGESDNSISLLEFLARSAVWRLTGNRVLVYACVVSGAIANQACGLAGMLCQEELLCSEQDDSNVPIIPCDKSTDDLRVRYTAQNSSLSCFPSS